MRIEKCNFCSADIYPGKGTEFVRNDSKKFRFCRKKCRLAMMKKKNPARTKWTKAYRVSKQKELPSVIRDEFEKRRITMVKYDSEKMKETLKAIPEVLRIIQKRKDHHIMKRLAVGTEDRKERDLSYVKNKMHLIRAPHAKQRLDEEDDEDLEDDEEVMDIDEEDEEMDAEEELNIQDVLHQDVKIVPVEKAKKKVQIFEMS